MKMKTSKVYVNPNKKIYQPVFGHPICTVTENSVSKSADRDGARTRDFEIALLGVTYDSHPHHPHSIEVHNSIDP